MSLINKMLQDLDARGSQAGASLPGDVRPAAPLQRRLPVRQIAIGASVLTVALALAAVFWLKRPAAVITPAPVVVLTPVATAPQVVAVAPVAVPAVAQPVAAPVNTVAQARQMPTPAVVAAPAAKADTPLAQEAAPVVEEKRAPVRVVRVATVVRPASDVVTAVVATPPRVSVPVSGRDMSASQRAETSYRNALAALDEGRVSGAFESLEEALRLHPRHDAARQSLVALLIEAGRNDEAMGQMEQGLAVDAAQPTLAMLLARMQIERGKSGVATLLRTLPSATGNADYHAFLAGALQRDARHREAVEQYGAALRSNPEHGVWLMGMGISLQGDKREREALAAFQRAKASGTLTAPLLAFVEQKVQQLAP